MAQPAGRQLPARADKRVRRPSARPMRQHHYSAYVPTSNAGRKKTRQLDMRRRSTKTTATNGAADDML